jgi:DNA (cytosine-5)-methyltransferase 1
MEDPRGNLTLTYLGLADKLKPKWIVYENVPGLLSSNGGKDFGSFLGALVELGYGFAYRVLDAQHFGVPQRRRRVFVVACLGDWRAAAEVLFESDCVRRDIKKGRAKGQGSAAGVEGGVGAGLPIWRAGDQASDNVQLTTKNCAFIRGDTPLVQPIPYRKSKRACSTTDNETWVLADAANTLNNFDLGDTRTTHAVVGAVYENHAQDSRVSGPLDVAPTVAAKFGTGGGNVPLVGAMAVRRLTPVECERLQGFPDNWSRISWKGKPEEQCPDGPRYKACGNSMAVPVMRWIGNRIAEYEAKA